MGPIWACIACFSEIRSQLLSYVFVPCVATENNEIVGVIFEQVNEGDLVFCGMRGIELGAETGVLGVFHTG